MEGKEEPTHSKTQDIDEAVRSRLGKEREESKKRWVTIGLCIWTSLMAPLAVIFILYAVTRINTAIEQGVQRDKDVAATRAEIHSLHEAFDEYKRSNDANVAEMKRKQDNMDTTLTKISTILQVKGLLTSDPADGKPR